MKPFADKVNEINDTLKASSASVAAGGTDHHDGTSATSGSGTAGGSTGGVAKGMDIVDSDDETTIVNADAQQLKEDFVRRVMRNHYASVLDQKTETALSEALMKEPLATVAGTPQSGNVLIHMDCNSWGEAASAPALRKVPMGKEVFKRVYNAVKLARYGTETPDKIQLGDIYSLVDANKDRRRLFTNAVKSKDSGAKEKDKRRKLILYCTENSVKQRRKRVGNRRVTCTQGLHLCYNKATPIPYREYKTLSGSNHSDMFGPLQLEAQQDLPSMEKKEKAQWWGDKRIVECGGPVSDSDGSDDSEEGEREPGGKPAHTQQTGGDLPDGKLPINFHQLPPVVLHEIVWSNNVKHVIDLSPSPAMAAVKILEDGGSYCCIHPTTAAQDWYFSRLREELLKRCDTPGTKMHASVGTNHAIEDANTDLDAANADEDGGTSPQPAARKRRRTQPPAGAGAGAGGAGSAAGKGGSLDIAKLLAEAKAKLTKPKGNVAGKTERADDEIDAEDLDAPGVQLDD